MTRKKDSTRKHRFLRREIRQEMTYASLLHVGTMPDDSDRLNSEVIYGASRSMLVLSCDVGIASFIEYLLVACFTIVQMTSVVRGVKGETAARTLSTSAERNIVEFLLAMKCRTFWPTNFMPGSPSSALNRLSISSCIRSNKELLIKIYIL